MKKVSSNTNSKKQSLFMISLLLYLIIEGSCGELSYDKVSKNNHNRIMHSTNGNPSKKGSYFLMTWNKGNGKFCNMRDNIAITMDRFKPDFFAIQEANFEIGNDKGFIGYNVECNQLSKS